MIYGSVCSGIEAATVAWHPLGWRPAWFSEIERFPCAVLRHHYPTVPNLGDMTRFREWPDATIDLLVGGTPCQSFSVAGLRKGLDDPRGNLMLTYLAIARRYAPRWLVWENVPGVLSSNDGRDFGTFLGGLAELGYGFAYRVLDAQYVRVESHPCAVPQRRRRVFVVGHLGDWRRAAAVLFERESLLGHPAPSRQTGKGIAPTLSARTKGGGGLGTDFECDGGLIASTGDVSHCLNAGGMGRQDYEMETLVAHTLKASGYDASEDGAGRGVPLVARAYDLQQVTNPSNRSNPQAVDPCFTLAATGEPVIAFDCKAGGNTSFSIGDIAGTLRGEGFGGGHAAVALRLRGRDGANLPELSTGVTPALRASQGGSDKAHAMIGSTVRRLTPRECERLQGFPDDYTRIPIRVMPARPSAKRCRKYPDLFAPNLDGSWTAYVEDGPRYKAIGNSMAVSVMRWIGERIELVEQLATATVRAR
ncbi:DNA (cytosine-5-)-methyltransferase [Burkholderia thailandensis]|uniref:DNA (cytosine-5-)-methyltransferase n=1 Tax=Burkholderia thailandensis TaxID=57975 RepID=UPI0003EC9591|nr:DNA cytosine methyltransferase [Burkholderia thailandensis]AHI67815.1 DNA (cytosine-5-)-methyltransferase family protein [Burkholderia thailandensis H0587]